MRRSLDYEQVVAQSDNENTALHCISGVSRVLLLAGLEQLQERFNWIAGNEEISDSEFDEIEDWVSDACLELMTVCETIGEIIMYVSEDIPVRCLPCDSTVYSAEDYPELYAVIDNELKNTENETFITPNFVGRMPVGEDVSQGFELDLVGGYKTHTLSSSEMPAHTHDITTILFGTPGSGTLVPYIGIGIPYATTSTGGGQPHNNMPPWACVKFAIRCGREVV